MQRLNEESVCMCLGQKWGSLLGAGDPLQAVPADMHGNYTDSYKATIFGIAILATHTLLSLSTAITAV
jgi:hypothetical protein